MVRLSSEKVNVGDSMGSFIAVKSWAVTTHGQPRETGGGFVTNLQGARTADDFVLS